MQVRTMLVALAATASLVLASACAGDDLAEDPGAESGSGTGTSVTIAGQNFPEATLVASMYQQLLEAEGYAVKVDLVGTRDVYMGKFPGDYDIVPEYVGGLVDFLNTTTNGPDAEPLTTTDADESIGNAEPLLEQQGITLLEPSEATDTNAFFVTREYSEAEGVTSLSDLEGVSVVLAAAPDCEGRGDCEGGLTEVYGIDVTAVLPLGFATDQTYQSVLSGESQLGLTSTTDGTLEAQGLVLLEDDRTIQPAQNLVPAVGTEFLDEHPEITEPLNALMAALTTENLTELNGRMSVDREKPEDVAREFLESQGLV